jgi:hypothetical protein
MIEIDRRSGRHISHPIARRIQRYAGGNAQTNQLTPCQGDRRPAGHSEAVRQEALDRRLVKTKRDHFVGDTQWDYRRTIGAARSGWGVTARTARRKAEIGQPQSLQPACPTIVATATVTAHSIAAVIVIIVAVIIIGMGGGNCEEV